MFSYASALQGIEASGVGHQPKLFRVSGLGLIGVLRLVRGYRIMTKV